MRPLSRLEWRICLLLAVGAVAWLLSAFTEVRQGERAVVRRFGRVLDVEPRPGLWIGFPAGIDRVDRIPVEQLRRVTVGYNPASEPAADDVPQGQLLTGDRNLVNVRIVVNYTVDREAAVSFIEQADVVEDLIARAAEAALAEWVGGRKVDAIIRAGKSDMPPALRERMQPRLDGYRLGVKLQSIDVALVEAPAEVKPAFDRVGQAEAEERTMLLEAEREARSRLTAAETDVRKIEEQTRAYMTSRPDNARKEAASFEARLAAYRIDPLIREAGRWAHLVKLVTRLAEGGQLTPLDPDVEPRLPGQK